VASTDVHTVHLWAELVKYEAVNYKAGAAIAPADVPQPDETNPVPQQVLE